MTTPRVLVCTPTADKIEPETMISLFSAGKTPYQWQYSRGALPHTFNILWADVALNLKPRPDYLVWLHDDVAPAAGWLDALVSLMDNQDGIDYLNVPVPIKGQEGTTNNARYNVETGELMRFTLKELYDLPVLFCDEDLGESEIIFPGTGLAICRFAGADWVEKITYETTSGNFFDAASERWKSNIAYEDYILGIDMAKLGIVPWVTTAIHLRHVEGRREYPNHPPWGTWKHDEQKQVIKFAF